MRISACVLFCSLCACVPLAHAADTGDPWEGFNRKIMAFNDAADRWVMKPVARGYTKVVPRPARRGVSNFFSNLLYPIVIVNQFLQGKFRDGVSDIGRFVVNTTVGLGGLLDPATAVGLPRNDEDFGQTFGKWGAGPGPYIVVPFLGPSTLRDGTGALCSAALTPWRYSDEERVRYGATALYAIDARAGLLEAEELISGDRYTFLRDAYLQRREFLVQDGEVEDDFMDESWDEEAVEE